MMHFRPIATFCWGGSDSDLGWNWSAAAGCRSGWRHVRRSRRLDIGSEAHAVRELHDPGPRRATGRTESWPCSTSVPGRAAGVEANLRRWLGQFVKADGTPIAAADADRSDQQVGGMQVTVLDVTGTYLFKPFPMAPQATPMPGYRMLAAIVQGPDAPIFFKLTAPAKTVAEAEPEFRKLIASLRR